MKGLLIAILALVATPVLAQVDPAKVDLSKVFKVTSTSSSGSIAARAASEVNADENTRLVARQGVQFCALPPSVFVGNPGGAMPANLDGMLLSSHHHSSK